MIKPLLFTLPLLMSFWVMPDFFEPFIDSKWFLFYTFCLLVCAADLLSILPIGLLEQRSICFKLSILVFILVIVYLIVPIINRNSFISSAEFLQRALFLSALLPLSRFFQNQNPFDGICIFCRSCLIALFLVIFHSIMTDIGILSLPKSLIDMERVPSSFGNINMLASFVGLGLPFIFLGQKKDYKELKLFYISGQIMGLCFLVHIGCRSVLLGVTTAYLVIYIKDLKLKMMLNIFVFLFLSICIVAIFIPLSGFNEYLVTKMANNHLRWVVIDATLNMIIDHPLGIGPGNFADTYQYYFNFEDVVDRRMFRSPHNDLLKTIAENGVANFAIILVIFILSIVYRKKSDFRDYRQFFIFFFTVANCEFIFQFPLELGHTNFYLIVAASFYLSFIKTYKSLYVLYLRLFIKITVFGFLVFFTYKNTYYSMQAQSCKQDLRCLHQVCSESGNSIFCIYHANVALATKNYHQAKNASIALEKNEPLSFHAKITKLKILFETDTIKNSCDNYSAFKSLNHKFSFLTPQYEAKCSSMKKG